MTILLLCHLLSLCAYRFFEHPHSGCLPYRLNRCDAAAAAAAAKDTGESMANLDEILRMANGEAQAVLVGAQFSRRILFPLAVQTLYLQNSS